MRKYTVYVLIFGILIYFISSVCVGMRRNLFTFYYDEETAIGDITLLQNIDIEFRISDERNHIWNVTSKDHEFNVQYEPYQADEDQAIADFSVEYQWMLGLDNEKEVEKVCSQNSITGEERCTRNIQVHEIAVLMNDNGRDYEHEEDKVIHQAIIRGKTKQDLMDLSVQEVDEEVKSYTLTQGARTDTGFVPLSVHQDQLLTPNIGTTKREINYAYVNLDDMGILTDNFELINDFSGIYQRQIGTIKKLVAFDTLKERIMSLGLLDDRLITSVVRNHTDAYIELYDLNGKQVSQLSLGDAREIDNLYIQNDVIYVERNKFSPDASIAVYTYQDDQFENMDTFIFDKTSDLEDIEALNYRDHQLFILKTSNSQASIDVQIRSVDTLIFQRTMHGTLLDVTQKDVRSIELDQLQQPFRPFVMQEPYQISQLRFKNEEKQ